ncbi:MULTISPECIES: ABC-2 family transporter protein [unclassified Variovorax]|uniref:ABC transporter permease n=1 Tax=unclassified Variovorax TaxID=663243 RepID=UPI002574ECA3|nr:MULTISPECIES: ABC-2 family transporter protein [unclassified Variovorax]MDM0091505.1 ABC-2 family transporter protein [Variovorax sp. J22G40]MDM0149703.1 ABC-2 family transporter protein [Variovorax sp. J2P1-31]
MGAFPLFLRLVRASVGGQARYPASALLLTVGQFLGTGIEMVAVWALFHRFGSVQGWHIGEVALFYGLVNCMFAIADALGRGFDVLGTEFLRTGAFDRLLLRPRPLALQLMGHDFRISRLGRLLQGVAVLVFATHQAPIAWTPATVAVALFALVGGIALFLGILVLQGTLAFWTVESLEIANVLTYGGVQAAQYPLALYANWFRRVLTFVVPLACVAYYPALAILGKADPLGAPAWMGAVSPLAGFVFLAAAFGAWRLGLRRYASTGS